MNRNELKMKLSQAKIPQHYYNIDETGEIDQRMCLEHNGNKWVVYYSERGRRFDENVFLNEDEACLELYNRLIE